MKIVLFSLECRPQERYFGPDEVIQEMVFTIRTNEGETSFRSVLPIDHMRSMYDHIFDAAKDRLKNELFKHEEKSSTEPTAKGREGI